VKNEFDYNLSNRKAIYVPYTGALPNVPVIDKNKCIRFEGRSEIANEALEAGLITKRKNLTGSSIMIVSSANRPVCFDAINYEDTDQILERNVGGIITATGFELFDPSVLPQYGMGRYLRYIPALSLSGYLPKQDLPLENSS